MEVENGGWKTSNNQHRTPNFQGEILQRVDAAEVVVDVMIGEGCEVFELPRAKDFGGVQEELTPEAGAENQLRISDWGLRIGRKPAFGTAMAIAGEPRGHPGDGVG